MEVKKVHPRHLASAYLIAAVALGLSLLLFGSVARSRDTVTLTQAIVRPIVAVKLTDKPTVTANVSSNQHSAPRHEFENSFGNNLEHSLFQIGQHSR